jgi:hypothetical protein
MKQIIKDECGNEWRDENGQIQFEEIDYKSHKLYAEFQSLLNDDAIFADQYDDNESDFVEWVNQYQTDGDWLGINN